MRLRILQAVCRQPHTVNEIVTAVGATQAMSPSTSPCWPEPASWRAKGGPASFYGMKDQLALSCANWFTNISRQERPLPPPHFGNYRDPAQGSDRVACLYNFMAFMRCKWFNSDLYELDPQTGHASILRVSNRKTRPGRFTTKSAASMICCPSAAKPPCAGRDGVVRARAGENVLEIGFGTGHSLVALAKAVGPKGMVFGLDLSDKMMKLAKSNLAQSNLLERARLRCGRCGATALRRQKHGCSVHELYAGIVRHSGNSEGAGRVQARPAAGRAHRGGGHVKGGGRRPLIGVFEWTHEHFPNFLDCRPIYVREALEKAGVQNRKRVDEAHVDSSRNRFVSQRIARNIIGTAQINSRDLRQLGPATPTFVS